MMNQLKKVNAIQASDTGDLFKEKLSITQKLMKLKRKLLIMIMINILLFKNLSQRQETLLQTNKFSINKLSKQNDIVDFVKTTDFNDKLKELNKEVTSDKTKHVEAE